MTRWPMYVGPTEIDCPLRCVVPARTTMHQIPKPMHAWRDVLVCPNDDCGRSFLLVIDEKEEEA